MPDSNVHIFGIRHHGPGSARSLERALTDLKPDCILIEGPPDADDVLALAAHEQMQPPVALLVYVPDDPKRSAFYPFATFSPEWRAMLYGQQHRVPTRFIDLPQSMQLGDDPAVPADADDDATAEGDVSADAAASDVADGDPDPDTADDTACMHHDPLGHLARAAGFTDGERWWDHVVESRQHDPADVFAAVREAMTALRDDKAVNDAAVASPLIDDMREQQREAHMRKSIRAAQKEGFECIAVVCGAWHAPALEPDRMPSAKHDNDLLKGLKKVRTQAAWTPWTYGRLAYASGYGAGVVSPAWYELLWSQHDHIPIEWLTRVARLMRDEDLDTSSAHVIEAVRLSEALAALRERPLPGLEDLDEAALTVICGGQEAPMKLIRSKLVIGEKLGAAPDHAPMAPLQRDLAALQKRLRLPAKAEIKPYDLDLRKPIDLERSHLLHRLQLIDVPWGERSPMHGRSKGTFHEHWAVGWQPEFAVRLIEASRFGNTIDVAASARTLQTAEHAKNLRELTVLLDHALLAALPHAVAGLVTAIQHRAATGSDVPQLMGALPPLAQVMRYGNVRQTDTDMVAHIVDGIVARICVGLPGVCASLNDDAAAELFRSVIEVHSALATLQNETLLDDWLVALRRVADSESSHHVLSGRAVRILYDTGRTDADTAARYLSRALSRGTDRVQAAAWIEGFLQGSGMVLIHDAKLWAIIDQWVSSLSPDAFIEVLPLLRRTFSTFDAPERRQMGERVKRGMASPDDSAAPAAASAEDDNVNHARAGQVLPLIAKLLGREVRR